MGVPFVVPIDAVFQGKVWAMDRFWGYCYLCYVALRLLKLKFKVFVLRLQTVVLRLERRILIFQNGDLRSQNRVLRSQGGDLGAQGGNLSVSIDKDVSEIRKMLFLDDGGAPLNDPLVKKVK